MAKTRELVVISREEAARLGRKRFYTGEPCKHGHISERFVANAGCVHCAARYTIQARRNPYSHDLIPYGEVTFWRSKRHTPETLVKLKEYVQAAIKLFEDHTLGPVCPACDGTKYVPVGDGSNNWKLCEACAVSEPSTADTPTGPAV